METTTWNEFLDLWFSIDGLDIFRLEQIIHAPVAMAQWRDENAVPMEAFKKLQNFVTGESN